MRRSWWLLAALSPALPTLAWPCSPAFSVERHSPEASTTVPDNALFQLVGPISPSAQIEVQLLGQAPQPASSIEIPDQSYWTLNNVLQVSLPPLGTSTAVRITVDGGFGQSSAVELVPSGPADLVAPTFTGNSTIAGYSFIPGVPGGGCIIQDHLNIALAFPRADDDVQVAHYTVYETSNGMMRSLSSLHASATEAPGGGFVLNNAIDPTPGNRCFAVVARDLAGNESLPLESCADIVRPSTLDGGIMDSGALDAGAADTGANIGNQNPAANDQGCTCALPRGDNYAWGVLGTLLCLGLRRRRRG